MNDQRLMSCLWLYLASIASLALTSSGGILRAAEGPNILLILADDLGYGDVRCYNDQSKVATPNLDRLARDGMRFTDAHSPCTVCTPTRYGLMTGQMPFRVPGGGTVFTGVGGPSLIARDRLTLPTMLREQGYSTACVGKWHVGLKFFDRDGQPVRGNGVDAVRQVDFSRRIEGGPVDHGFDSFFGTACCPTTDWLYAFIENDRVPVPPTGPLDKSKLPKHPYANDCRPGLIAPNFPMENVDLVFLEESCAFLEQHVRQSPDKPFFLLHSTQAVHLPSFAAKRFQGKSQAGPHGDFILELDHIVGEFMATLEKLGVADNTLILFTSDNGPETTSVVHMRADHAHDGARPWRGFKRDNWEGGHRVPFIARWPGKIPANTSNSQITSLTDVMATVAAIVDAKQKLSDNSAEDSFNMLPAWLDEKHPPIRPYLLTQAFSGQHTLSIRRGDWKYIAHAGSGGNRYENDPGLKPFILHEAAPDALDQLYNLATDPGETNNLYNKEPSIVAELKAVLDQSKKTGRSRNSSPTVTIERETRDISGWRVHIAKKLLENEAEDTARALAGLKKMLDEIVRDLPAPAVAELKKVPLYFSTAYRPGRSGAEFHPGADWLRENGRDPAMVRGVEFSGVHDFEAEMRRMPNFALHELAHAFHHRVLPNGFDNAEIKAAYERAKSGGSYERVERTRGDGKPNTRERAYGITNAMEYFAETTEAYFARNDFFPFTRDELQKHDPEMHALLGKLWGVTVAQPLPGSPQWLTYPGGNGPGKGKHIVLIAAEQEYRSEQSLPMMAKILSTHHGFDCTVLFGVNERGEVDPTLPVYPEKGKEAEFKQHHIPGLEHLASADLVIFFTRLLTLPPPELEHIVKYVDSGKPIIALRTANHGFRGPLPYKIDGKQVRWGEDILGGTFLNHHGRWHADSTRGSFDKVQTQHPILTGVAGIWGDSDVYRTYKEGTSLPSDCTALVWGQPLMGRKPDDPPNEKLEPLPVAWVKPWQTSGGKTARVFHSTMGSGTDLKNPGLRRLVINAAYWGLGMESSISSTRSVEIVGSYEPLESGFNYDTLGVKPHPVSFYR